MYVCETVLIINQLQTRLAESHTHLLVPMSGAVEISKLRNVAVVVAALSTGDQVLG